MTLRFYIPDTSGYPVLTDGITWALWMERSSENITVAYDTLVGCETGEVWVSTVYLGIAYSDPPLLWESMVLGGVLDGKTIRYQTREGAVIGHKALLTLVKERMR